MRRIAIASTISAVALLPLAAVSAQAAPQPQPVRTAVTGTRLPQHTSPSTHGTVPQGLCDYVWIPGCNYMHI